MSAFKKTLKIIGSQNLALEKTQPSFFLRKLSNLKVKMPSSKRYFVNNFPQFNNESIEIQLKEVKQKLLDFLSIIEEKLKPIGKNVDGGLYVGTPGIAYMFFHLHQSPIFAKQKEDFIKKALIFISASENLEKSSMSKGESGFLLGNDGVHAIAAAIYNSLGMKEKLETQLEILQNHAKVYKPINFFKHGSDELFVGRAGYLMGARWLERVLDKPVVPASDLVEMCISICDSGRSYAKKHHSPCPLMFSYYDTEYLGAAHGLCSILQALLSCPEFMKQAKDYEADIKESVDFLLSLQTPSGNFPCAMDEIGPNARSEDNELVHWCHGAPGVVYLMAKAYLTWKDNKYLESCLKCGDLVWQKGLLKKGPGICHGVAGSGYVFLLLHRLTGDPKHLYRAQQFAHFLFSSEFKTSRTPDCPYSLYEGLAGTVCYLGDLLHPSTAAFPFMDVY